MKLKLSILRTLLTIALCAFVYAHAATRYVSHSGSNTFPYTTWETAANTIEAANLATLPGDTMFVDTGSYQLTQTIVLPSKITLRGKGMDSTTILGSTAIVDMFKPGDSTYVEDIYFRGNNWFRGFTKYLGVSLFTWTITRCKFTNFLSAPIYSAWTERVDVSHCWFGGWGDPGAIAVTDRGDCTITNCTFYSPGVVRPICSFSGNSTGHEVFDSNVVVGGGFIGINGLGGGAELKYNLFCGKSYMSEAVYGGVAMEVAFNSFYMDIPWNFSYADVLTISSLALGRAYIYNNIFAGMNPRVIFYFDIPDSADIRINYNCFYSNYPMTRPHIGHTNGTGIIDSVYGNVYADPMFVDPDNGDLRLQKGSPCIDAGAPWILDVDGTRSDIGAFGGPGGSVYIYQDLPPKASASMTAWRDRDRVILSWERNSESDFLHYILFRTTEPGALLDSEHVLTYLDRLGRPIGNDNHKEPLGFDDDGKQLDQEQYIPMYAVKDLRRVYYVDWYPIDTLTSYYTLVAVDSSGLVSSVSSVSSASTAAVAAGLAPAQNSGDREGRPYGADVTPQDGVTYELEPNYPNPFNATTALVYHLPSIGAQPAPVHIEIFNIFGQRVKTLVDTRQSPGRHTVYWDGTNEEGQPLSSGVYFCRLEVSGIEFVKSGKMILMK
ncbi:MAG: hypothetical protein NT028_09585 [candidate division Zixibacteria bacterium]|nr:hypothetical protein [candidate division Zixibacteria bacterium]